MVVDKPLAALEMQLDAVHAALRAGNFAGLAAIAGQTEALIAGLPPIHEQAALARMKSKASRNAACLKAASQGLRAARRRMEEVQTARQGLGTYDSSGKREASPHQPRTLTHRA